MIEADTFCPLDKQDWRNWLELNHEKVDAIWIIFFKKKSPNFNLSWSESVDEALCYGWIDSTKKTIDDEKFKQYFSKRKEKSNWSKVNKRKVEQLVENGLMKQAGIKSIEIAKENGSWTLLDPVEDLITPEDLTKEFMKYQGAQNFYDNLSNSAKKILLYWVYSAKRAETRQKRVTEIAENAGSNLKPKQFR